MTTRRLAFALAISCALGTASAFAGVSVAPPLERTGTLLRIERGASAYGFDTAWRVEFLWRRDGSGAWHRVVAPEESALAPLRGLFLLRVKRPSLGEIPAEGKSDLQSLKSLGYL
jgi:hypothetical protein